MDYDGLNCTNENLVAVTRSAHKQKGPRNHKHEYIGIHQDKRSHHWRATYKGAFLGSRKNAIEAAHLYDQAVQWDSKVNNVKGGQLNFDHDHDPDTKLRLSERAMKNLVTMNTRGKRTVVQEGITYHPASGKYSADYKAKRIGTFETEQQAIQARAIANKHGLEYAKTLCKSNQMDGNVLFH